MSRQYPFPPVPRAAAPPLAIRAILTFAVLSVAWATFWFVMVERFA